jgi:hypothetical protein
MKRHHAPQLDLPTPGETFALVGEVIRHEAPEPATRTGPDPRQSTLDLDNSGDRPRSDHDSH